MPTLPNFLVLLMTLQCPLECEHCIVDAGPRRKERLELTALLKLIDEAAAFGISTIGFTGGEPFLLATDLERCVRKTAEYGLKSVLVTNAFWANSEEEARRTLEPLSSIHMLGISADDYHQRFTSISNVRHAIHGARNVGISRIEVQVTYLDDQRLNSVRSRFGDDLAGVTFKGQKLWPVGRAASLLTGQERFMVPLDAVGLDCPSLGLAVTPDHKLSGCCAALLQLSEANPMIIGDLSTDTLGDILSRRFHNSYFAFIKTFGLGPIVDLIRRSPLARQLKPSYTETCHLCHDVHSLETTRNLVAEGSWPKIGPTGAFVRGHPYGD